jgi:hypothetical protein
MPQEDILEHLLPIEKAKLIMAYTTATASWRHMMMHNVPTVNAQVDHGWS